MEHAHSRELRAAGAGLIAVAGHLLLVLVFVYAIRNTPRPGTAVLREPLFVLIDVSPRLLPAGQGDRRVPRSTPPVAAVGRAAAPVVSATTAAPDSAARPVAARIDWQRESALAGARFGAVNGSDTGRSFTPPLAPSTQVCEKSTQHLLWNRELKRAGFIGGLPYVRLGKRCLVGLPFFGCAIGHLPEADSQLLANMDEADRARSSVPDFPDCLPR